MSSATTNENLMSSNNYSNNHPPRHHDNDEASGNADESTTTAFSEIVEKTVAPESLCRFISHLHAPTRMGRWRENSCCSNSFFPSPLLPTTTTTASSTPVGTPHNDGGAVGSFAAAVAAGTPCSSSSAASVFTTPAVTPVTVTRGTTSFPSTAAAPPRSAPTTVIASEWVADQQVAGQPSFELYEEEVDVHANLNPDLLCLVASRVPTLALEEYIKRLMTYCRCSKECYLIAARYMERLSIAGLPITPRSEHRVFMACLLLAIKYRDDHFFPTSYYAQCGGVHPGELRSMELQCFLLLGYDCGVQLDELRLVLKLFP